MGIINGQQVVSGFMVVPQYKWVKLRSGVTTEKMTTINADDYNGKRVSLYGAAMKYKAPKRTDGKSYGLYLNLGIATYNGDGVMQSFTPVVRHMIADGTSGESDRYGAAVIDGSNGIYRSEWFVGNGYPPSSTDFGLLRPGSYHYTLLEVIPDCNCARISSPRQENDEGMIEPGTEYEIWGLIKEV